MSKLNVLAMLISLTMAACDNVPQNLADQTEPPTTTEPELAPKPTQPVLVPVAIPSLPLSSTAAIECQVGSGFHHDLAGSDQGFLVAWQEAYGQSWQIQTTDQDGRPTSPKGLTVLGSGDQGLTVSGLTDGYLVHDRKNSDATVYSTTGLIKWQMNAGWQSLMTRDSANWAVVQDSNPDADNVTLTVTLGGVAVAAPVQQYATWWKGSISLGAVAVSSDSVAVGYSTQTPDGQLALRLQVVMPSQNYVRAVSLYLRQSNQEGYPFVQRIFALADGSFLAYWGVNHASAAATRYLTLIDHDGHPLATVETPHMQAVALAKDGRLVGASVDQDSLSVELYRFSADLNLKSVETIAKLKDRKFYYLGVAQVAVSGSRVAVSYPTSPDGFQDQSRIEMTIVQL